MACSRRLQIRGWGREGFIAFAPKPEPALSTLSALGRGHSVVLAVPGRLVSGNERPIAFTGKRSARRCRFIAGQKHPAKNVSAMDGIKAEFRFRQLVINDREQGKGGPSPTVKVFSLRRLVNREYLGAESYELTRRILAGPFYEWGWV
jgi:hypothetical protein